MSTNLEWTRASHTRTVTATSGWCTATRTIRTSITGTGMEPDSVVTETSVANLDRDTHNDRDVGGHEARHSEGRASGP